MEISEVRVKLVDRSGERLRAFCSITLDNAFVIRDLKIIGGTNGAFVAMPSRKLADRCRHCGTKNHLRSRFCNECGKRLDEGRAPRDGQGRAKLHADIAHPINATCRESIQQVVMEAFEAEVERSKSPDYEPTRFDDLDEQVTEVETTETPKTERPKTERPKAPVKKQVAVEEPVEVEASHDVDGQEEEKAGAAESVSDYDSLIADLKQEAAGRRSDHRRRRQDQSSFGQGTTDDADDTNGDDKETKAAGDGNGDDAGRSENRSRRRGGRGRGRGRRGDSPRGENDRDAAPARELAEEAPVRKEPVVEAPKEKPAPVVETSTPKGGFGAGL